MLNTPFSSVLTVRYAGSNLEILRAANPASNEVGIAVLYEYGVGKMTTSLSTTFHKKESRNTIIGILFALPWIIGFLMFSLYPILASLVYSFTEYSLFQPPKFLGLANYITLFKDDKFYMALYNTFFIATIGLAVKLIYSLAMALLLNLNVKGMSIYRTIYYIPSIVPVVASSVLWIWILNPQYGLVDNFLKMIHMYQPAWCIDPRFTKPSLIMMDSWASGGTMIIFLSALQSVPQTLYEAADLDGANVWKKFLHITIPAISPVILFQVIMGLIYSFQYFTQAFMFSSGSSYSVTGGPENSLLFYALYIYQQAFSFLKMGYASAMAWILFIIVVLVSILVFKTSIKWVYYNEE